MLLTTAISIEALEIENKNFEKLKITYEFDNPIITKTTIEKKVYDKIELKNAPGIGDPGDPFLPAYGAYILIPYNKKVTKIDATYTEKIDLGTGFNIMPTGKPIPISQKQLAEIPTKNNEIYTSNQPFPSALFSEVGTHSFRGFEILVLMLNPVQYLPATGEISYYKNIEIVIETESDNERNQLYRGCEKDFNQITKKIDNPSQLVSYPKNQAQINGREAYDLLIITSNPLKNSFLPLKQAHENKGTITEIKTLNDIGSSSPEDIRQYIKTSYLANQIEYVLIGGDHDIIADQQLWVEGLDEGQYPYSTNLPSDLYYSCLDGTYNYDGDAKIGETTDGEDGGDVDLIADVYVGRACVGDSVEVGYFVDKTTSYMNLDGSEAYLQEVLQVGENLGDYGVATWGGNYMDQQIDGSTADGYTTIGIPSENYTIHTLYDRDWSENNWPYSEFSNQLNLGRHFINHLGHSWYDYNFKMHDVFMSFLTNDQHGFIYSQGCMAGGFDDPEGGDCMAEYFTSKNDHGAFAGIWNARYGWFWSYSTDGDSQRFHRQFWDAVFNEDITSIGMANHDSKEDNLYMIGRSCMRWVYYETNLFGDPSIRFHIAGLNPPQTPQTPIVSEVGSVGKSYDVSSVTYDCDGDYICYLFDWGDGTDSGWLGPYSSGEEITKTHTWQWKGVYEIQIKAKDQSDLESGWSEGAVIDIFVCGDANGDGSANSGDAIFITNYIFKGGAAPYPLCVGDVNSDGSINIGDAVYLINYIFKNGDPPASCC